MRTPKGDPNHVAPGLPSGIRGGWDPLREMTVNVTGGRGDCHLACHRRSDCHPECPHPSCPHPSCPHRFHFFGIIHARLERVFPVLGGRVEGVASGVPDPLGPGGELAREPPPMGPAAPSNACSCGAVAPSLPPPDEGVPPSVPLPVAHPPLRLQSGPRPGLIQGHPSPRLCSAVCLWPRGQAPEVSRRPHALAKRRKRTTARPWRTRFRRTCLTSALLVAVRPRLTMRLWR